MSKSAVSPLIFLVLLLAFAGMFGTVLFDGITSSPPPAGHPTGEEAQDETPMSDEQAAELGTLMKQLQENPNDAAVLAGIGAFFLDMQDWARAEAFLTRAVTSRPSDTAVRYQLGMVQYEQKKIKEAVQSFEELLEIKADPVVMFNLAMIYKYDLTEVEKARLLLNRAAASPDAGEEIRNRAKAEL